VVGFVDEQDVERVTGGGLGDAMHNAYTGSVGAYQAGRDSGEGKMSSLGMATAVGAGTFKDGLLNGKRYSTAQVKDVTKQNLG